MAYSPHTAKTADPVRGLPLKNINMRLTLGELGSATSSFETVLPVLASTLNLPAC